MLTPDQARKLARIQNLWCSEACLDVDKVLTALAEWIHQRPRLDPRDYGTDANGRRAYRSEQRSITKDKHEAMAALSEALTLEDNPQALADSFRAFSGRLSYNALTGKLNYTTGQYFPTEYRKAARAVLETYVAAVKRIEAEKNPPTFKYWTIEDVKRANRETGKHFFDRSAMRFFNCRVESPLIGRAYFVTSERQELTHPKRYSVRHATPTGDIRTVGEFCAYQSKGDAMEAAREAAFTGEKGE